MKALKDINEEICRDAKGAEEKKNDDDNKPKPPKGSKKALAEEVCNPDKTSSFEVYPANKGEFILNATCARRHTISHYLSLLNEAREKLDDMIDILHKNLGKPGKRPHTYRQVACKAYLGIVRNRKPGKKARRKAIGKQLHYVRRNFVAIDRLLSMAGNGHGLSQKKQETLSTKLKVCEQQHMYTERTHKINDRIVSISQQHVRPTSEVRPQPIPSSVPKWPLVS